MGSIDPEALLSHLRARRSIRRFNADPLEPAAEERLIEAMLAAPSDLDGFTAENAEDAEVRRHRHKANSAVSATSAVNRPLVAAFRPLRVSVVNDDGL